MVWGGNIRLIGRGLGLEIDEITEELERLPLEESVDTVMGPFEKGTQGAFWLKIIGWSGGKKRIVIDHITRIHPSCAPHWPQPDEGAGDHRVFVDGDPQLTIVSRADLPGGNRADGGNTTAANRLLGAIEWLADAEAGHLRRARRAAAHDAARRGRGDALGLGCFGSADDRRSRSVLTAALGVGQLADEVLGEPTDGRVVEHRGRVDRELAAELTVQPVAEFDRHQ